MGKYFGTDGFRGEVNKQLTADHAYRIGRFVGWYFLTNKSDSSRCRIVIGKDTRRSSYMFEYALSAGINASGADTYLLHVTTTASVSYITRTEKFDCGIMITASHNSYIDNGIKLINTNGEKMDEGIIERVEAYLDGEFPLPFAKTDKVGITVDYSIGRNRYMGYLTSLSRYSFRGKRIGLDCANGASWTMAKSIFDSMGATTYVINNSPNGLNINKDCGSTHIEGLRLLVLKEHLDAGFAFDGDADRCICVDENGNTVDGDGILYVSAAYLKSEEKLTGNAVVATVMSNYGLSKACEAIGVKFIATGVGDKFVYDAMRSSGSILGGEQSGHIIFGKIENTGDGIVTAIKILEIMVATGKTLSELTAPMAIYPQKLTNVKVANKDIVAEDKELISYISEVEKTLCGDGRVLVRKSGTEPVVRVMAEAKTDELCADVVRKIVNKIIDLGYLVDG